MTSIGIAYGDRRIPVEVPDENLVKVFQTRPWRPLPDPKTAIASALENPIGSHPLSSIAAGRSDAVVVISDITRPVPNSTLLPPILDLIERSGVPRDRILILIATGMHRPNLADELVELVGEEISNTYRIENHIGTDLDGHFDFGVHEGVPLQVDRRYVEADLKVVTGLIEPHLIAGYSGGRKGIIPGLCSLETMKVLHGFRMIQHERAASGNIDGNPFHETALVLARKAGCDFLLNVTLNSDREITGVFAGDLDEAHRAGCASLQEFAMDCIDEPVDIVLTGGGGAPLDRTFYQAIKGMIAAREILKPGGTILFAASLTEGLGSPSFRELMKSLTSPREMLDRLAAVDYLQMDQWMVQDFCSILLQAGEIQVHTEGIPTSDLEGFGLVPIPSFEAGLARAMSRQGRTARIAALPDGPYVIAKIAEGARL